MPLDVGKKWQLRKMLSSNLFRFSRGTLGKNRSLENELFRSDIVSTGWRIC